MPDQAEIDRGRAEARKMLEQEEGWEPPAFQPFELGGYFLAICDGCHCIILEGRISEHEGWHAAVAFMRHVTGKLAEAVDKQGEAWRQVADLAAQVEKLLEDEAKPTAPMFGQSAAEAADVIRDTGA